MTGGAASFEFPGAAAENPSALRWPLLAAASAAAVLVAVSLGQDLYVYGLPHAVRPDVKLVFEVEYEKSIYTWLSSTLLFAAAALLAYIAGQDRQSGGRLHRGWLLLALVFLALSLDEHVGLHEWVSDKLRDRMPTHGLFTFGWVIPALPLCLVGGLVSLSFLRRLTPRIRKLIMLSAAIYVGGALGLEMVGAAVYEAEGHGLRYYVLNNIEEAMEGLGVLLFLYTLDLQRRLRPAI